MAPDLNQESPEAWDYYRRQILTEIARLGSQLDVVKTKVDQFRQDDIADIKTEIALLKLKSSLWGAAMGGATAILVTLGGILLRLVK